MKKLRKNRLCNLIFKILARSICALYQKDSLIKHEIDSLPKNFTVSLGIFPYGSYINIVKEGEALYVSELPTRSNLDVIFKSISAAQNTMLARQSVAQSFCKHQILVRGDIACAMTLVRVINRAEGYLFPRFMTRKFLPKTQKEFSSMKLYLKLFKKYKLPAKPVPPKKAIR